MLTRFIAIGAALLLGAAAVAWLTWNLAKGQQAVTENQQLRADLERYEVTTKALHAAAVNLPAELHAAMDRLNAISQQREKDRETLRNFTARLSADLQALGARHPALRDLDLGTDFLRHWNRANDGPGNDSGNAAAGTPGQSDPTLPTAASSAGEHRTGNSGGARSGNDAVSRMPQHERPLARSVRGMACHRLALVLRDGGTDRTDARQLRRA